MSYDIESIGKRAKTAARTLALVSTQQKNNALLKIADTLCDNVHAIIEANNTDIAHALENGISAAMIDRLRLTPQRIDDIADAIRQVVRLDDPVGRVESGSTRPNGLRILKQRVPMGVVGIIYEARPNVTVDAAVLCLKSSNACILRGGKEAIHSNKVFVSLMRDALKQEKICTDSIILIEDTARETAVQMMRLNGYIDVLIPRGGAGLIQSVVKNATVPVIETGVGNCHMYVDYNADLDMAVALVDNGKTSRPSVCNAIETVLIHRDVAEEFLPKMRRQLDLHEVELRGCETTCVLLPGIKAATEDDYATEFNDYILAVRVVEDVESAIEHITKYSSGHSECIITNDYQNSQRFIAAVDAAAVYVNASTRFTDGGEFGFGAEIGISTQKLHARGPMGLSELTTCKYIVTGDGQIR